jgi:hypothetical protein
LRPTLQPQKYLRRKQKESKSEREKQPVSTFLYYSKENIQEWTHFDLPALSHARTNTHARTHDSLSARFLAFPFHGHVLGAFVRAVTEGLCTGTEQISMCSNSCDLGMVVYASIAMNKAPWIWNGAGSLQLMRGSKWIPGS